MFTCIKELCRTSFRNKKDFFVVFFSFSLASTFPIFCRIRNMKLFQLPHTMLCATTFCDDNTFFVSAI